MSQHLLNVLSTVFYYGFIIYMTFINVSYIYLKHLKDDKRFRDVGFLKYFESPVKTFKGEFCKGDK